MNERISKALCIAALVGITALALAGGVLHEWLRMLFWKWMGWL